MNTKKILGYLIIWRIVLLIFLFLSIQILPLQMSFLGGGISNYLQKPYLWAWVNFDGEHYFSIANLGYQTLTYFYFPVFPLSLRFLGEFMGGTFLAYILSGLLISHAGFFLGLVGFVKLIKLDYSEQIAKTGVILLLLFPTSFFFASFYSEGMFFALVVWTFYFARKNKWIMAGILGAFATATRVVGIALFASLIYELYLQSRSKVVTKDNITGLIMIPFGLLIYMLYLNKNTGDPLNFFHSVGIFGQQRSSSLVLLPQVFFRYLIKILPNVNYNYFPVVFTTYLEIIVAVLFVVLLIILFFKSRLSYALFAFFAFLVPTLSGSFSSLPRYVLIIFPAFILMAVYISKLPELVKYLLFSALLITLGIATSLFLRGYWVS